MKVNLTFNRECKYSIRYDASDAESSKLISSVYINREALRELDPPKPYPERISIEVTKA